MIAILMCFWTVKLAYELAGEFFLVALAKFNEYFTPDDIIGLLEAVF